MIHTLKIFLVSLGLVLAFCGSALATIITVPGDQPTIQQGLNVAQEGDTVLVAPGAYYEVIFWPATNGIKLLSEAGAESTTIDGSNLSSVIYFPGLGGIDTTTVVRGFRITNGGNVSYGGGIYMTQSSPIIEECVVDSNNAGSGIYCNNASNPTIRFCTVSQNSGGGIVFINSSAGLVDSCTISGNSAGGSGGGIYCSNSSNPTLTNCTISGNSAGSGWCGGGGISCSYGSNPTLTNCTITGNSAGSFGGGIWCDGSNPTLTNCTISGNSAGSFGGGIYCNSSNPTLTNCTISGNSAGDGGGICCSNSSNPTLTNCTISGNSAGSSWDGGGGIYCDYSNPTLTNCTISGNSAVEGGGIHCKESSSPIIKNCTITDNRASDNGDGIYTTSASWPTLDSNNICYNGYGVFNNDNSQLLMAADNWWGHASGPYHPNYNPGGQGDSTNYFVYPLPYLTEADTIAPPIPPVGLDTLEVGNDYVSLVWFDTPIGDLAGYKVYFDSDSSGFPYLDTIDVGMDTTYTLDQLSTGTTYYIAVTCYDNLGNESWYSREIYATPWEPGVDSIILLHPGWQWVSTNIDPDPSEIESLFVNCWIGHLNIIIACDGSFCIPGVGCWIPGWNVSEMYRVHMANACTIQVCGSKVPTDTPIPLPEGWNCIAYFPDCPLEPETALVSIWDNLDIVQNDAGEFCIPGVGCWIDCMEYNEGYKIHLSSVDTLIYPTSCPPCPPPFAKKKSFPGFARTTHFNYSGNTGESYSIVVNSIELSGKHPELGDEIGVFTSSGLCVGAGVWQGDILGIAVWQDDDRTEAKDGFAVGEKMVFKLWDKRENKEIELSASFEKGDGTFGTVADPASGGDAYALVNLKGISSQLPKQFELAQNYPNPFNPETKISYALPKDCHVKLTIYNMLGQKINVLVDEHQTAGHKNVHWDGKDYKGDEVASGIYFYKLDAVEFTQSKRMVLLK